MSEELGAAPSEAADVEVMTEGQPETVQPAEVTAQEPETEEAERSKSAERRERKKEADRRLREELDQARAKLARYEGRAQAQKRPDPGQYSDPDQYLAELAGWSAAQAVARTHVEDASDHVRRIETAGRRQQIETFEAQAQELAAQYPDFQAARQVAANPAIVSQPLSEMVLESDVAAHLAYHLGKNPTEAVWLSGLEPGKQERELGKIEARIASEIEAKRRALTPKTVTTAPAPLSPVKPAGTAMKNPDDMTPQEWASWRLAGGKP